MSNCLRPPFKVQHRRCGRQAHRRHADRQQESLLVGRFYFLCGQGAVVSLRKTWTMQEVSLGSGGGGGEKLLFAICRTHGFCVGTSQVLYRLQRPVLRLGGRRSLQEGGRKHQVSHVASSSQEEEHVSTVKAGGIPFSCCSQS